MFIYLLMVVSSDKTLSFPGGLVYPSGLLYYTTRDNAQVALDNMTHRVAKTLTIVEFFAKQLR